MSYRDPYTQQHYTDQEFNPYSTNDQAHPSYDQSGSGYDHYNDTVMHAVGAPQRQDTVRSTLNKKDVRPLPIEQQPNPFHDNAALDSSEFTTKPDTFKAYRRSYQETMWTRGGRGSCFLRFCCCTLFSTVFLTISILLTLALWVRPPSVDIGQVTPNSTNEIQLKTDGVSINLGVNISVHNPNYFTVVFPHIDAQFFYPINNTAIGHGEVNNIKFASHQTTNVTFPFSIDYVVNSDPNHAILDDLSSRCPGDLTISYQIKVGIRIVFVTVTPSFSNELTFACPLSSSDIDALKTLAGSISGNT